MRISVAQWVGKYRMLALLGEGGMGEVWLAQEPELPNPVAIKFLLPQFAASADVEGRFQEEAHLLSELEAGPIVQIKTVLHERADAGGEPLVGIVMQFLGGGSLDEMMDQRDEFGVVVVRGDGETVRQRVPLRAPVAFRVRSFQPQGAGFVHEPQLRPGGALQLAIDILGALQWIHDQRIVHRDIKPSNLMFTRDGAVRLADFGISRSQSRNRRLTQVQRVVGTSHYMSPEQAQGGEVGPQSDIYSFGVVLFEMLMGRLPFEAPPGASEPDLIIRQQHISAAPPRVVGADPTLDEALNAIVSRALAKLPGDRWSSCTEFRQALVDLQSGLLRPSPPAVGPAAHRWGGRWGVALAMLLCTGLVAWMVGWRRPTRENPGERAGIQRLLADGRDLLARDPCLAGDKAREAASLARAAHNDALMGEADLLLSRADPSCAKRGRVEGELQVANEDAHVKNARSLMAAGRCDEARAELRQAPESDARRRGLSELAVCDATGRDPHLAAARHLMAQDRCADAAAELHQAPAGLERAELESALGRACGQHLVQARILLSQRRIGEAERELQLSTPGAEKTQLLEVARLLGEDQALREAERYCKALEQLDNVHKNGFWSPLLDAAREADRQDCPPVR